MRHLTDDELAKYFDDGTQGAPQTDAPADGWSLDDAFANPKQGQGEDDTSDTFDTPVPLKRPALSDRPLRPFSKVSQLPQLEDDLSWTGVDAQPIKGGGFSKTPMLFMGAMIICAIVVVMMLGGGSGPVTGNLPQIGQ